MGMSDRPSSDQLADLPVMRLLSGSGAIYFGIGQAEAVAAWLADHDVIILGLEGFACDGKTIRPLTEYIADFSAIEGKRPERLVAARRAAEKILPQWAGDVEFVDFILEEE